MKAYADTNFFTRFYVPNPDLSRLIAVYLSREEEPLPFTPLHRLEFRNAVRLMLHRRRQRDEVDLAPEQARRILRDHENDLDERVFHHASGDRMDRGPAPGRTAERRPHCKRRVSRA